MLPGAPRLPFLARFAAAVRAAPAEDATVCAAGPAGSRWRLHFDSRARRVEVLLDFPPLRQTSLFLEPVFLEKVFGAYRPEVLPEAPPRFNLRFQASLAAQGALARLVRDFEAFPAVAAKWTFAGALKLLHAGRLDRLSFEPGPADLACLARRGGADATFAVFFVFGRVDALQRPLLRLYLARLASEARARFPEVKLAPVASEALREEFRASFADAARATDALSSAVLKLGASNCRSRGQCAQGLSRAGQRLPQSPARKLRRPPRGPPEGPRRRLREQRPGGGPGAGRQSQFPDALGLCA